MFDRAPQRGGWRSSLAAVFCALILVSGASIWGAFGQGSNANSWNGGPLAVYNTVAANNSSPYTIAAGARQIYGVMVSNNSATIGYLKLYDTATPSNAVCGTTTPKDRIMIPASTTVWLENYAADQYSTGVQACLVTGIADSSAANPAASAYIFSIKYR